jgi:hypothetical protein
MTPTQNSPSSETGAAPIQGKLAEDVKLVSSSQGAPDTHSPPPPTGRTVPSTESTGRVWLRYSVQRGRNGPCESSTKV